MCVSWHEDVLLSVRSLSHHSDQASKGFLDILDLVQEPEPHVRRYLIVAGPSSMEFSAQRSDELGEPSLVRSMDVLVVRLGIELDIR